MPETFNISELSSLAKKLLDKCENGEEFLLGQVYNQVRQAYQKFPEDAVIRSMSAVIERMVEKNPPSMIVNQKQLTAMYNDLVRLSGETKFRVVLGHLLFSAPEQKKIATNLRDDRGGINEAELVDPRVKAILQSTFDEDLASKAYNKELAIKGVNYVKAELKSVGFNSMVKIADGNAQRIVYTATIDSVKGPVAVYVPTTVKEGKFVLPTTFIDDQGEKALNRDTLTESLERRGGKIEAVKGIRNAEIDLPEIATPKVEMPKELAHLAADFENQVFESGSEFGKSAVDMGKKIIANELRAAGFKNAQVRYGSDSNESVIYYAGINTPNGQVEIEVPLEMKATIDNRFVPLMPTCFAYEEAIQDFTAGNLQKFAVNAVVNKPVINSMYGFMTLSELKEELIKEASVGNYTSCEEIIAQVAKTFNEEDHKNVIADYQYILTVKAKASENQVKFAEIAKESQVLIPAGKGSIFARLPNGQPIKDLVKDENGQYRKASEIQKDKLNPVEETGACISTSRILFS